MEKIRAALRGALDYSVSNEDVEVVETLQAAIKKKKSASTAETIESLVPILGPILNKLGLGINQDTISNAIKAYSDNTKKDRDKVIDKIEGHLSREQVLPSSAIPLAIELLNDDDKSTGMLPIFLSIASSLDLQSLLGKLTGRGQKSGIQSNNSGGTGGAGEDAKAG
jgi:hypothetical protein